jgi:hypothetical protein
MATRGVNRDPRRPNATALREPRNARYGERLHSAPGCLRPDGCFADSGQGGALACADSRPSSCRGRMIAFTITAARSRTIALATKRSSGSSRVCAAAHDRNRPEGEASSGVTDGSASSGMERRRRPSGGNANSRSTIAERKPAMGAHAECRPSLGASCRLHNAARLRLVTRFLPVIPHGRGVRNPNA